MGKKRFVKYAGDEEFRKIMTEALESAKKEIIVITGEFGAYSFPDLKQRIHEALAREC